MIFNLPNILTGFRLFVGPIGALFLWWALTAQTNEQALNWWIYSLVFFIAGAVTDFLDGWVARKTGQVSAFGAILDPIADKVFVAGFLIVMAIWSGWALVSFPVAAILARDIVITAMRLSRLGKEQNPVPVSLAAKFKTTFEMGAIGWFFALAFLAREQEQWPYEVWVVVLWMAAGLSLYTGFSYVWAQRKKRSG